MSRKDDVLGSFTKKTSAVADTNVELSEKEAEVDDWAGKRPYEAFKSVDRRQLRLRLRPVSPPWDQVKYQYMLHMPEDDQGTFLCLVFTFLVVVIKGRNLQPVSSAIGRENCSVIWAYNPAKFDKPVDQAAPFIESIDIRLESRGEVLTEVMAEIADAI